MECIIFGSLYQVEEEFYFYAHLFFFIEELSIYVARKSGVAFPLYKQGISALQKRSSFYETLRSPLSEQGILKAQSYISWLHSLFYHIDM